ncbi:Response regulator receiver domain-containing protein [Pseudooceanicola antarcticus]|uniref:Response regulator n=1 Tax=Pseudooceanicola antarcticus TaxID=1247613 RepID=A0A285I1C0_9RHOB|nr:response regulator [Pseudooceanicola antarcticus]PJE30366.1 response regulator [Pseudooceanicola antarcticus]SNY40741.1 Response regulator receiver domain-containing protein [Pseudooceanicola antarcticus]
MARILIADDDPDYLSAFREGMAALGHEVVGVGTGAEAVEALSDGVFDIVFLDVFMNGGGAISVIHTVKNIDPDVSVVIITGKTTILNSPILEDGLRLAKAKISKSASLAELDRLVRNNGRRTS